MTTITLKMTDIVKSGDKVYFNFIDDDIEHYEAAIDDIWGNGTYTVRAIATEELSSDRIFRRVEREINILESFEQDVNKIIKKLRRVKGRK